MATLSPAKALLLAVQVTSDSDLSSLRTLVFLHGRTLTTETTLRILLSYLPETLESADYVSFLTDIIDDNLKTDKQIDISALDYLTEEEAKLKARKLHLLPLAWPDHPLNVPADPLVLFLIHRSRRIDENTGLIVEIPELLTPFFHHSTYLRQWFITFVLPLLRLFYEYHPEEPSSITISTFERLSNRAGVDLLLSRTGQKSISNSRDQTVGRDLRGLVGPWLYGDTRSKWKEISSTQDETPSCIISNEKNTFVTWEEVFKWIVGQATTSWKVAVAAIEHWDGPGDVDTGGFSDGNLWLKESDEQHLELRYARSILAAAYSVLETSNEAFNGIQHILSRLVILMDKDKMPSLEQAAALLQPVPVFVPELTSRNNVRFLRGDLLDKDNVLTRPEESSIKLLHALLVSAYVFGTLTLDITIRKAAEVFFQGDTKEQNSILSQLMLKVRDGPVGDDQYWIKSRNKILWLRSWGQEQAQVVNSEKVDAGGALGMIPRQSVEVEILKAMLKNTRYTLVRSIYYSSPNPPLDQDTLRDTILAAALDAFDNASNPNKTRGGVKKCLEIITFFHDALSQESSIQVNNLIEVSHAIGSYKLVFKQGEPFKPVVIRVHQDPISIIGRILDQNPGSYAQINNLIDIGRSMIRAGLPCEEFIGARQNPIPQGISEADERLQLVEARVTSLCIDAALAEDDFETAYSYVTTRLKSPVTHDSIKQQRRSDAISVSLDNDSVEQWSWKAALQAGKYRRTEQTTKPTHLGNASANPEIRHLEQRIECLSKALLLAPSKALPDILNVFRRVEEERNVLSKQEEEKEEAWDRQGDNAMPGGFSETPAKSELGSRVPEGVDDGPVSLFHLSREGIKSAQNQFAAFSLAKNTRQKQAPVTARISEEIQRSETPDSMASGTVRKRDQLRNAAVGSLASGVGWLIGAQPVKDDREDEKSND